MHHEEEVSGLTKKVRSVREHGRYDHCSAIQASTMDTSDEESATNLQESRKARPSRIAGQERCIGTNREGATEHVSQRGRCTYEVGKVRSI